MNRFILKNIFINIYISLFNKYFYKNKQSKLYFEGRIAVLNVIYFLYRGSTLSRFISLDRLENKLDRRCLFLHGKSMIRPSPIRLFCVAPSTCLVATPTQLLFLEELLHIFFFCVCVLHNLMWAVEQYNTDSWPKGLQAMGMGLGQVFLPCSFVWNTR